jgi:hypothetical protein
VNIEVDVDNLHDSRPSTILIQGQENWIDVLEGESVISDLEVTRPDKLNNTVLSVDIVGGVDADKFEVLNGVLRVASGGELNFEDPKDHDKNNYYELEVQISDIHIDTGVGFIDDYFVTVHVQDRDEWPPAFLNGEGKNLYELSVSENQTFVEHAKASDVEYSTLVFSVVGGAEEEFFKINATHGILEFEHAQNFEYPSDANKDGRYEVIIQVSDGTHDVTQTIIVRLTDANDIPYVLGSDNPVPDFEPGSYSINEDTSINQDLQIIDEDGDLFLFELLTPPSRGTFSINANKLNYIPEKDFNGTDSFVVKLSDDQGSRIQTLTLNVLPVNDPPVAVTDDPFYGDLSEELPLFFDVLENDHAGPDDPSEESNYIVTAKNLPTNGKLEEEVGKSNLGRYYYTPNDGFIGEDTFEYILSDGNDPSSFSTGLVRIWIAKTQSMPKITTLRNFGEYVETDTNWIYSLKLGWVYTQNLRDLYSTTWIWHDKIGWFWTGEEYFGWLYYNDDSKWLHWEGGVNESSGWFMRDAQKTPYYSDHFLKRIIRNQVIDILPNLDELADFVNESTFFTDSQKSQILRELVFTRKSSTLSSILEFDFSY